MSRPFENLRILDFTRFLSGPFATHQFALQGAEVIKIEPPTGDDTRTITVNKELAAQKMAPAFMAVNTNKRSVVLDLKQHAAIELIHRMVQEADIVWENFRPGVMDKLGLGYEALKALNPRLIYCSISGFGHTGPEKHTPAFDGKIQAMSGVMSITGEPEHGPMRAGFALCDVLSGMTAAFAVSTALYQRTQTGQGQHVDVSMLDASLSFLSTQVADFTVARTPQRQFGNLSMSRKPTADRFRCGDGYIVLAAMTEAQFQRLFVALGREDVLADERFKDWFTRYEHRHALREIIESAFGEQSPEHWEPVLERADVPCARVMRIDEIVEHPQLQARQVLQQVVSSQGTHTLVGPGFHLGGEEGGGGVIHRAAPTLGEHTEEVLRAMGLRDEDIALLGGRA
ncbi:CaiB/BaiF CoA transferase family protein [Diaphorobacter caeni]|uniref:CaiB/BaiF CoA transferase family protein n=1 Tax=Diaphorobacter caeni TaxID=2784387 RepID=UPI00188F3C47|nr:CoA transferase [Diaphorobacter caeni]MBF5006551.1 CoA transferase [Diaphorobacter caeni]